MAVSVLDLFKIGIGPSSSHTVGPMRAARRFARELAETGALASTARVVGELYGSLGATGYGHGTDKALLLGLAGEEPDRIDPDAIPARLDAIRREHRLVLDATRPIGFDEATDLVFRAAEQLPAHPNGLRLTAWSASGERLARRIYYSVGGGFVVAADDEAGHVAGGAASEGAVALPLPFHSAAELLAVAEREGASIAELMRRNETAWRATAQTEACLLEIWGVMQACATRGCRSEGTLPGGLNVRRRAAALHRSLESRKPSLGRDPLQVMDWVNLWALAVNEENAAGGRVVTAPTNGAAGIVPAVLHFYLHFVPGANERGVIDFLLTAGAIGILYKMNASLSGAEVGCQGEVGVACSMAAAGLCAVWGGSPAQVENAAEIGMEHHLGMTCDPVGGLVQVPCIERNAIASVKAINAARMALNGDGTHVVSLDSVIKTMRETGNDMHAKYKETARGGLAVNVIEC
jgi:L-serine dehydratase